MLKDILGITTLPTFLLIVQTLPLNGQTSLPPTGFERLRDSVAAVADTSVLRNLLRASRDSDFLRAGIVALRLGELQADSDFSEALSSFRRASRDQPGQAEPWFGQGLAWAGRSQWEMSDRLRLGSRVGLKSLERAADRYTRALQADVTFVPAALELAQVELALLDTAGLSRARHVLRKVAHSVVGNPEVILAWGRVERAAGALDAAAVAFERYLASGGDRAMGLLELARTRLALGRSDGDQAYYEGAALDDPEALAGYRADLELIAADSNIRQFDRLNGQARAAYLHRFWTDRDHLELRREGERLREHYRRVLFARAHFPLTISRRYYGRQDAFRSGSTEVDDRGIIYIRQGEPANRLRPFIFGTMPNESWRYDRAEGDLLFHFSAGYDGNGGGDLYDYRLVQSVFDLRGAADAPPDQLILSRQSLSPIYNHMLNWGKFGAANERDRERTIGVASIEVGTTTDSYELRFKRRLSAVADLIAVGHSPAGTLAHLVFGVVASGTVPRRVANGVEYPVRVRLVALDRHDRAVGTLDTTFVIQLERPLSKDEYLVGRAQLPLPAGRWSYRAALQQGDGGTVLPRDTVLVTYTTGTSLSLSDIALGTPGRAVPWVTEAGDTVLLAPSKLFRQGVEVQIYYEATGVIPRAQYRHEITVLKADTRLRDDSRRPALVSLSFDEEAAAATIRSRRTVRLDRLKQGSYIVQVRISGPDGSTQVRRRLIQLIGR